MSESQTVEAIYENGVLRPLKPLEGLVEHCRVKITIEREETTPHPLLEFAGVLSDDEATELRCMIDDEFEKIDPNAW